jgi:hypothetical protein
MVLQAFSPVLANGLWTATIAIAFLAALVRLVIWLLTSPSKRR